MEQICKIVQSLKSPKHQVGVHCVILILWIFLLKQVVKELELQV